MKSEPEYVGSANAWLLPARRQWNLVTDPPLTVKHIERVMSANLQSASLGPALDL